MNNMDTILFKIIGIVGLLLICIGLVVHGRNTRDILSGIGGILLLIYSVHLRDLIFTILQGFYVCITIFDYIKNN